jgi:hypothetical protein
MAGASVSIIKATKDTIQYTLKSGFLGYDSFSVNYTNNAAYSVINVQVQITNEKISTSAILVSYFWKTLLSGVSIDSTTTAVQNDIDGITLVSCGNGLNGTSSKISSTNCNYFATSPFKGTDTITFILTDGIEPTNPGVISITSTNNPPTIQKKIFTIQWGQYYSGKSLTVIDGSDSTGDSGETWSSLTISSPIYTPSNSFGSITTIQPDKVTVSTSQPYVGFLEFSITASDGLETGSNLIDVYIVNSNKPASSTINLNYHWRATKAGINVPILTSLYDLDGDYLTLKKIYSGPATVSVNADLKSIDFTYSILGSYSVGYNISDGMDFSSSTINIQIYNTPPVASNISLNFPYSKFVDGIFIDVIASYVIETDLLDIPFLQIVDLTNPNLNNISISGSKIFYKPANGYNGLFFFNFLIK